jgi:hypothetical protein
MRQIKQDNLKTARRFGLVGSGLILLSALGGAQAGEVGGSFSSTLKSKSIISGSERGKGPISENLACVGWKRLGGFVWHEYDAGKGKNLEVDYGVRLGLPIPGKLGKLVNVGVGAQYWTYPEDNFKEDRVFSADATYNGPIDLKVDLLQLFDNGEVESGNNVVGTVSKTFGLSKIFGSDMFVTPSLSTSHRDNYYGKNGIGYVQGGVELAAKRKNFSLSTFLNYVGALKDDFREGFDGGVKAEVSF